MSANELKPCKCGNIPELVDVSRKTKHSIKTQFMVKCYNHKCCNSTEFYTTKLGAIDAWNRRADDEQRKAD